MHKACVVGITTDGIPKRLQKMDHKKFGIAEMYMNEYFLQFHRHSLAPLKILEQEFDGKDLNEEEKEIFK